MGVKYVTSFLEDDSCVTKRLGVLRVCISPKARLCMDIEKRIFTSSREAFASIQQKYSGRGCSVF